MGAAFGGAASQSMFSSQGAGNFVSHLTTIVASIFMISSLSLSWASSRTGSSRLKSASKQMPNINTALDELGGTKDATPTTGDGTALKPVKPATPVPEKIPEAVKVPATKDATPAAVVKPVDAPVEKPAVKPEAMAPAAAMPVVKPMVKPVAPAAAMPVVKPMAKPMAAAAMPVVKPVVKPMAKPMAMPAPK